MSNISYDFLTESFLFNESESKYAKRSISEISNELNKYRDYITNNIDNLDKEIRKTSNFIQPLLFHSKLPSIEDLLQGCIFLDTYIIDDPMFRFDIEQIKMGNVERIQMGAEPTSDEEIKNELYEIVTYMKTLTPGVNVSIGYIKFFPLGLFLNNYFKPYMRFPDLSTDSIDKNVFEWFKKRINLINLDNEGCTSDSEISNRIVLNFENDNQNGSMICHYKNMSVVDFDKKKNKATLKFDPNYIPTKEEYNIWTNQEIIKLIKERLQFYSSRDFLCAHFNSPLCLASNLEKQFYKTNFDTLARAHFHNLGFNLRIPGLQNMDFEKAMEIRNHTHLSFVSLQNKIQADSKQLRAASDFKTYKLIINEIENEYLQGIKQSHTILNSIKNLFSPDNISEYLLSAESYYTGTASNFTTGVTIAHMIYNAGKVTLNALSNPMYFLKKISNNQK